jgi:hypothetical protein
VLALFWVLVMRFSLSQPMWTTGRIRSTDQLNDGTDLIAVAATFSLLIAERIDNTSGKQRMRHGLLSESSRVEPIPIFGHVSRFPAMTISI